MASSGNFRKRHCIFLLIFAFFVICLQVESFFPADQGAAVSKLQGELLQLHQELDALRSKLSTTQYSLNECREAQTISNLSAGGGSALPGGSSTSISLPHREGACDLTSNLLHVQVSDYPRQYAMGPMQADEMLATFSMIRASSVTRVLEVGGFKGDSAWNFLEALRCRKDAVVYTVDLNPVRKWKNHPVKHVTMQMDATTLTMKDVGGKAVDLVLLDCHAFAASQNIVNNILDHNLLSRTGLIVLHDTGLHPADSTRRGYNKEPPGMPHQPVERLLAQWIQQVDCLFQRISLHDDQRQPFRHGLTIMQRRANLDVNDCSPRLYRYADYKARDCEQIQEFSKDLNKTCPVF